MDRHDSLTRLGKPAGKVGKGNMERADRDDRTKDGTQGEDGLVNPSNPPLNRVRFTLPSLPGSVNEIYGPRWNEYARQPSWGLKDEWRIWKTEMWTYVRPIQIAPMSLLRVDRRYWYQWFYKNGNWRKADVANMDKLLFDLIESKTEINDLRFKQGWMDSKPVKEAGDGRVEVVLTEVREEEWRR